MTGYETGSETVGQGVTGRNLIGWAVMLVREPKAFFASLAKRGGFGTPVVYALFWLFLSAVVELVAGRIRPQPVRFGWGIEVGWLIAGPFVLVALGFIVSAVFFVIWHLMGSKENYETAFRCWAFTTPVAVAGALLGVVPFLNTLAFVYGLYLLVMASIHAHGISPRKSWSVWGAICALVLALVAVSLVARSSLERQGLGIPGAAGIPAPGGEDARLQDMATQIQKQMEEQMKDQGTPPPAAPGE